MLHETVLLNYVTVLYFNVSLYWQNEYILKDLNIKVAYQDFKSS
jgi:hypothetical protein